MASDHWEIQTLVNVYSSQVSKSWSGWRVYSQEIPVLLTGRVWDQAFLLYITLNTFIVVLPLSDSL